MPWSYHPRYYSDYKTAKDKMLEQKGRIAENNHKNNVKYSKMAR